MVSVGRHENITLLSYSEVENVSGYVGNFQVQVRKKARYVDPEKCTGCGVCWNECITRRIPHEKLIKKGEMSIGERRPGEK